MYLSLSNPFETFETFGVYNPYGAYTQKVDACMHDCDSRHELNCINNCGVEVFDEIDNKISYINQ